MTISKRVIFIVVFVLTLTLPLALFACDKNDGTEDLEANLNILPDESDQGNIIYTITFDSNGGSSVSSLKASAGEKIRKPSDPTKDSSVFEGWYKDRLYSAAWDFSKDSVNANITLYAKWTANYRLKINGNDYNGSANIPFVLDSSVSSLSLTDKILLGGVNQTFAVYTDASCTKQYGKKNFADFTDLEYGDTVFYLRIFNSDSTVSDTYTLTVHRKPLFRIVLLNTRSEVISSTEISEGDTFVFPDYAPVGESLSHWYLQDNEQKTYRPNTQITITSDMILCASVQQAVYTVTLNANGGSVPQPSKQAVTFGKDYTFPVISRSGFFFSGWYTENGVALTGSNGVSLSTWNYCDITEVYARWTTVTYPVTVTRKVGGTVDTSYTEIEDVDHGGSIALEAVLPDYEQNTFYVFCGWYTEQDQFITLSEKAVISQITAKRGFYQKWATIVAEEKCSSCSEKHLGKVTVYKDGKIVNTQKEILAVSMTISLRYVLSDVDSTHTAEGWEEGGEELSIVLSGDIAEKQTVYCSLQEYKLNVDETRLLTGSYNVNGNAYTEAQAFSAGRKLTLTAQPKDGLIFTGWYQLDNINRIEKLLTYAYTLSDFVMPKQTVTVLPVYVENSIKFRYNESAGSYTYTTANTTENVSMTVDAAVNDGYYFSGYYIETVLKEEPLDWDVVYKNYYPCTVSGDEKTLTSIGTPSRVFDEGNRYFLKMRDCTFDILFKTSGKDVSVSNVSAVYLDYKVNEITVSSNMPYAGSLYYEVDTVKHKGSNNGENVSFCGISCNNSLTVTAITHDGYTWLGWYLQEGEDWVLLSTDVCLEIKEPNKNLTYRATWKPYDLNITVSEKLYTMVGSEYTYVESDIGGTGSFDLRYNTNGEEFLLLQASINGGYIFEGWFVTKKAADGEDKTLWKDEEICLSQEVDIRLNIADLCFEYDLTTITAKFVSFDATNRLKINDAFINATPETGYVFSGNYGSASIIGYYKQVEGKSVLYADLVITIKEQKLVGANLSGYSVNCFLGITDDVTIAENLRVSGESSVVSETNFSDYSSVREASAKDGFVDVSEYDANTCTVVYTFDTTKMSLSKDLVLYPCWKNLRSDFRPNIVTDAKSVLYVTSVRNAKMNSKSVQRIIAFRAEPADSMAFYSYAIDKTIYTDSVTSFANIGSSATITVTWKSLNTAEKELVLKKNVNQAGVVKMTGTTQKASEKSSALVYKVQVSATTSEGYDFVGWYDNNDNLISNQETFSFICNNLTEYFADYSTDTVIYTAYWREVDAAVVYEKVTDYSVTGYIVQNQNSYYTLSFGNEHEIIASDLQQSGYCFMGWYDKNHTLLSTDYEYTVLYNALQSTYYTAWKKVSFPAISFNDSMLGQVTMKASYNKATKGIRYTLTAEPTNNCYLDKWEINGNDAYGITYNYDLDFDDSFDSIYVVFGNFGQEFTFKNSLNNAINTGANPLFIKKFTYYGYNTDESSRTLYLSIVPANGYKFDGWKTGTTISYEPTREIAITPSMLKEFTLLFSTDTFSMQNESALSGNMSYYVYQESASSMKLHIAMTPKNNHLLYSVVVNGTEYFYGSSGMTWTRQGNSFTCDLSYTIAPTVSVRWASLRYSLAGNEIYLERESDTVLIFEEIDDISVHKKGYLEEIVYKNGSTSFEEKIEISTEHTDSKYSFISWINQDVEIQSTESVYRLTMPLSVTTLKPRWGRYKVQLNVQDLNGEIDTATFQYPSAESYVATVSFSQNKNAYVEDGTYISEISFYYSDCFDEETLSEFKAKGYSYSKVDLNAGEGGKYIVMLWLTTTKQDQAITSIVLSKTLLTDNNLRLSYFLNNDGKEIADLNKGVYHADTLYVYTARLSSYGNRITQVGIEQNGVNADFFGTYNYVDGKSTNLTSASNDTVYLVYREKLSAPSVPDTETDSQVVSLVDTLSYADNYTNVVYNGTVFGGWYDNVNCLGNTYDFAKDIAMDITLYAKWYVLGDYKIATDSFMLKNTNYQVKTVSSLYFVAYDTVVTLQGGNTDKNMTTTYSIYDLVDRKNVKEGKIESNKTVYLPLSVTAGHLYRVTFNTGKTSETGVFNVKIAYSLPRDGGGFNSYIPYGENFQSLAKTNINQTFRGWFDEDGNHMGSFTKIAINNYNGYLLEASELADYTAMENCTVVTFEKGITVPYKNIQKDLYLTAYFGDYSVLVYNTMPECGVVEYTGETIVGNVITLKVKEVYQGFKFNGWLVYDKTTGKTVQAPDSSYQDSLNYTYQSSSYIFKMQAKDYVFIPSWGLTNAQSASYTIEYELDGGINDSHNRTTFYSNTEKISLYSPTKTCVRGDVDGYYIFQGWYFDTQFKKKVSGTNATSSVSIDVLTSELISNAVENEEDDDNIVVKLYAKWSEPICSVTLKTDKNGVQYIEFGSYPTSLVTDNLATVSNYIYNKDGFTSDGKYYREMYQGEYYYYKMEKIRWNVIFGKNNSYCLQADKILFTDSFHTSSKATDGYSNTWETSYIRSYLNNEFMSFAFNELEINYLYLNRHFVSNSSDTYPSYLNNTSYYAWMTQNDTYDYVFLPSYADLTNNLYAYELSESTPDVKRIYGTHVATDDNIYTDYALIHGLAVTDGTASYYIRTAGDTSYSVFVVAADGTLQIRPVDAYTVGIRPCIYLEITND